MAFPGTEHRELIQRADRGADEVGLGPVAKLDEPDPIEPDLAQVVNGDGPCNKERLAERVDAWNDGEWVREAALAHARKQAARAEKAAA